MFQLVQDANTSLNQASSLRAVDGCLQTLLKLTDILGILMQKAEEKLPEEIQSLVDQRAAARKEKRWADSDSLRDQLKEKGYIVEDTAQGQKVRRQIQ